jgi:hypothetical protein
MGKRAWIIVGAVSLAVAATLAAAYLTGSIVIGDPFSGVWNYRGTWSSDGQDTGSLIKQTENGYVFTQVLADKAQGWLPLQRDGRTLTAQWDDERFTFEYQPWNGRLVWKAWHHGRVEVPGMPLRKVTGSTSLPVATN